jgi:hypothetical protein
MFEFLVPRVLFVKSFGLNFGQFVSLSEGSRSFQIVVLIKRDVGKNPNECCGY